MKRIQAWITANRSLIANSSALVGTAVVNSGIGFVYWWLAAHWFDQAFVGLASATVSAMLLLGSVGMMGLGTLLVGEIAQRQGEESALLSTSMITITVVSVAVALAFALISGALSAEFALLTTNPLYLALFALGVALTALTLMLDQAFIGLLRGGIQLTRNFSASIIKLVALVLFGLWLADQTGMVIFGAWTLGTLLSLFIPFRSLIRTYGLRLHFRGHMVRELGKAALMHHWLNLALEAPIRLLPVIVTIVLTPELTASLYIAWMLAGLMFFPVQSLTLTLYAVGAQNVTLLAEKMHVTLRLSALITVVGYIAIFLLADVLMGLFGRAYAEQAANVLRILCVSIFPLIIKDHFVAVYRIHNRARQAALIITIGGIIEVTLSVIGASTNGLIGLSIGWVVAIMLEAIYMLPTVLRALHVPVFHSARTAAS
ncbi:MAG: oligosaccharide flippase family protein [Chloroflexi bacterium]|nr:oligosaccharide flippase family protein [Chloroflexota bacterium]